MYSNNVDSIIALKAHKDVRSEEGIDVLPLLLIQKGLPYG